MELLNLTTSSFNYYSVQFKQEKFIEKDPGKKCKKYEDKSYNDCDQLFIKKWLEKKYPLDLTSLIMIQGLT